MMGQEFSEPEAADSSHAAATPLHLGGETRDIFPRVYQELRGLAQSHLRNERAGLTLQTTALVHEVYLRLTSDAAATWDNPRHFFAAAAEAMRRILVERARHHGRQKRGGDRRRVAFDSVDAAAPEADQDAMISLNDALEELRGFDPDLYEVVMLRFFAGMTVEDVAVAIDRSPRSVKNDWSVARAWLLRRIEG